MTVARRFSFALPIALYLIVTSGIDTSARDIVRSGIVTIRLESEKTVYKLGEAVNLRVTVTNKSGVHYAFFWRPPYVLTKLDVVNGANQTLVQRGDMGGGGYMVKVNDIRDFPSGDVITLSYPHGKTLTEWLDIRLWGYELNKPGDYTIVSTTDISGFERANNGSIVGSTFTTTISDRSNAIHIKVVQ